MADEFESIFDPELLAEFTTESSESLADIENQLLQIEEGGANIDDDLVNTVFRGVHSIKGVAGFLGLTTINVLSHRLEDVLNRVRNRDLVPTPQIVDVMLKAADELRSMVADPETSNEKDVTTHVTALQAIHDNDAPPAAPAVSSTSMPSTEEPPVETLTAPPPSVDPSEATRPPVQEKKPATPPAETKLRVSVSTLDHLMNLAGEMVLNRNRLVRFSAREPNPELSTLASDIDHITCELQDVIMQTRMQPIANVFNRFPRVVRDLSSKLGKECKLLVEGKDVEVDKSIIEAIGDPLTHLIRNSVDHGIELPSVRSDNGKDPAGTIRLSAYHRAGQVCIDIEDDGGGIDPEKLRQKALSKGLITEPQAAAMGDREALSLIFHPGFSTAEKLTDVSGRGVGMDVVRTNIERIGGAVDVNSDLGRGTIIQITLPLTLAIIRSLIVGSQSQRFAIPQVNVTELVRISRSEAEARIERINDAVVFRLRGTLLPLIDLCEVLNIDRADDPESSRAMNIIVLETGRSRYGLVVENLHDSEEIVVKPLGRDLQDCPSLAGATILGDGSIAFILDIPGIADKADLNGIEDNCPVDSRSDQKRKIAEQSLLVFHNSPEDQFAIPLSLVARIERVEVERLEQYGARTIMKYRGGTLPLLVLEDLIAVNPREDSRYVSIVVIETMTGEFGLVAPRIEDINNVPVDMDSDSLRQDGILGSQIIGGETTRFLDVFALLARAYPNAVPPPETLTTNEASQTVLIAEDSPFFRDQLAAFLREAGYNVLAAEDGMAAMAILSERHNEINLVVTDIEMPNMSGLELCRQIRKTERFGYLPVIAVSSLVLEENIREAFDCGIDEYLTKDDQRQLLVAIHRLANVSVPDLVEV